MSKSSEWALESQQAEENFAREENEQDDRQLQEAICKFCKSPQIRKIDEDGSFINHCTVCDAKWV